MVAGGEREGALPLLCGSRANPARASISHKCMTGWAAGDRLDWRAALRE